MFERFTEQAIMALVLAQEESRRLGHNFIGTEQILLGLVGESNGVAAQVLTSMGVKLQDTRAEVEKIIGRGTGCSPIPGDVPYTPRAKQLLELACTEADQLSHHSIDTEHLLLGLIQIRSGVAARVLKSLGVDLTEVHTQLAIHPYDQRQPAEECRVDSNELHFKHMTPKAIKVILLANQEANRLGHNSIGTEHIFLGLISESSGAVAKVLKSMGVSLKQARIEVEKIIGRGTGLIPVRTSFTSQARRVLELSWAEANQLGQQSIGPEHLLLSTIREGEGGAVRALETLGVDLAEVCVQASLPQRHWLNWLGFWRS
jgi:ATP-dependent Clp protease ATP-binding subunit ClpA